MTGRAEADGGAAETSRRRRRRAVGPAGAAPSVPGAGAEPGWSRQPAPPEDDDERLLREVPPHHGA